MSDSRLSFISPAGAVPPLNAFHTLYIRLSAIGEGLMVAAGETGYLSLEHAAASRESYVLGELAGAIADLGNKAAQLALMLDDIRRDQPRLYQLWEKAFDYEPPPPKREGKS